MLSSAQEFDKKFLDSKHVLKVYFKPSRKKKYFSFLPLPILPVWLKFLHLSRLLGGLLGHLLGRLAGRLAGLLAGRLAGLLAVRLVGRLAVCWAGPQVIGQVVRHCQTIIRQISTIKNQS